MKKKNLPAELSEEPKAKKYLAGEEEYTFSDSVSDAFRQKNEKTFFALIFAAVFVILLLVVAAVADLLVLCFEVNRIFGYTMVAVTAILVGVFIVRPIVRVLFSRFFVVDVTADKCNMARRRNYRALKEVARALVRYNADPKNRKFRYLSAERADKISAALESRDRAALKGAMKEAYSTDVGKFAGSLIRGSAGKAFLITSVSQNDKVDGLAVLLINLSLVKQIDGAYGYRPSYAIYVAVLRNALIAYGMQNVNWFNVFGKFFAGVARKIPFVDTLVDSTVQGAVRAFLTFLIGYKTKKYLCSDYKKQEKLDDEGADFADDEVRLAAAAARKLQKDKAV